MKYENLSKATELCKKIDNIQTMLRDLDGPVLVKLGIIPGTYMFACHESNSLASAPGTDYITSEYVLRLKDYHNSELRKAYSELEKL